MRSGSRPAGGLVQDQQVRFGDGDGREREPLALAARQIAGMAAGRPAEPDAVERGSSPLFIPSHGEPDLGERGLLDEVAARILREIAGAATQLDRPCLRLDEARDDPRQRGLSGPVRPLERDDLAAAQLEIDPVQNGHGLPVREGDAAERGDNRARGGLCF